MRGIFFSQCQWVLFTNNSAGSKNNTVVFGLKLYVLAQKVAIFTKIYTHFPFATYLVSCLALLHTSRKTDINIWLCKWQMEAAYLALFRVKWFKYFEHIKQTDRQTAETWIMLEKLFEKLQYVDIFHLEPGLPLESIATAMISSSCSLWRNKL